MYVKPESVLSPDHFVNMSRVQISGKCFYRILIRMFDFFSRFMRRVFSFSEDWVQLFSPGPHLVYWKYTWDPFQILHFRNLMLTNCHWGCTSSIIIASSMLDRPILVPAYVMRKVRKTNFLFCKLIIFVWKSSCNHVAQDLLFPPPLFGQ